MNVEYFDRMRDEMLQDISAHMAVAAEEIGKCAIDEQVMRAMSNVYRHEFVPVELQLLAYCDTPLPIGFEKTISQPFIVALMTDVLHVQRNDKVLEIGTGLGYQAAILSQLSERIYSVEYIEELASQAKYRLSQAGCEQVSIRVGDGYYGWVENAPYDRIIVTAAPQLIPPPLISQLKDGGSMVLPAGLPDAQKLIVVEKNASGSIKTHELIPVRFSMMEGYETIRKV